MYKIDLFKVKNYRFLGHYGLTRKRETSIINKYSTVYDISNCLGSLGLLQPILKVMYNFHIYLHTTGRCTQ